ncbi:unnamed protein product [Oikopleura dioica]|uniref:Long-chain-fatty-acid--CoA ligase n=1 Tax=Oikopleura dioica TaxID=34765 RepID=E4X7W1_OIKDI|nr:unnamed protein product [Oikopleura dioica]
MLFTSGTSGNNKVVKISGFKTHFMGWSIANLCGFSSEDVFYTPLPLFHGNGGGMCLGQMLWNGSTVVIRDKFSASKFWLDVSTHKASVINYIGEIGSYLLAQPERAEEREHNVNFAVGNGLSQSVWSEMKSRFGISRIVEFYASTEGNCNLINSEGQLGACGFIPGGLAKKFFPVNLIKCNPKTMEPDRDENGLCQLVKPGEIGQIVGKIRSDYLSRFEGYSDGDASRRKIIKNVFKTGDAAFISGDLLRLDENGWCYFVQRVADCYRINGENISSTMIEDQSKQS